MIMQFSLYRSLANEADRLSPPSVREAVLKHAIETGKTIHASYCWWIADEQP